MHGCVMENVRKIKIKLENIWIDLIRSIYAPYRNDRRVKQHTGEVRQQEMAEQPPLDHESDQGEPKYEEDSVEANLRADRLEFIRYPKTCKNRTGRL